MADPAPPHLTEAAPTTRKRRFFQIHLSTAVVLMLVAGALVWANVKPTPRPDNFWNGSDLFSDVRINAVETCGWPIPALFRFSDEYGGGRLERLLPMAAILDSVTALLILLASAFVFERFACCRGRKP